MHRHPLATFALLAALLAFCLPAAAQDTLPVPTGEQLAEARKLVREVFEVDAAKTPAQKAAMARKLLTAASETKDDAASRYALLDEACNLAADAGDATMAMDAIARIKRLYGAEVGERTADLLTTLVRTAQDARPLVDLATAAVDTAIREDNFEAASKLAAAGQAAARKVRDVALVRKAGDLARDVREMKVEYTKAAAALAELENDPLDPAHNTAAGRYYCLVKGDWALGLSMLAFSDNPQLAGQARKDLRHPEEANQQVEIGDGWWDLGQQESGKSKDRLLGRAGAWYRQALPNLSGLTLKKVEVRLKDVPENTASGVMAVAAAKFDAQNVKQLGKFTGHTRTVSSLSFSPDGLTLASASYDNTIKLWDGKTGQLKGTLNGHESYIRSVVFSPHGKLLASAANDRTVKLWDAVNGTLLQTITGHRQAVCGVAFSPDGRRLASASDDYTVKIWDPVTGKQLGDLLGHTRFALSVDFSSDGSLLASTGWDHTVRLWDMKTGANTKTLTGHTDNVISAVFSPDGRHVCSGGHDETVRIWDVAGGQLVRTLEGHTANVECVRYSHDGGTIASGSRDDTVKLWDAATGQLLNTLSAHTDRVKAVEFHPGGKFLASTGEDEVIYIWGAE